MLLPCNLKVPWGVLEGSDVSVSGFKVLRLQSQGALKANKGTTTGFSIVSPYMTHLFRIV